MPISHIYMRAGKPESYRQAILDGLYQALKDTLNVPDDDQFITITEHDPTNFRYGDAFDMKRSDDLLYIRITVFDNRTADQKKALYHRMAEILTDNPGVRPEDLFITTTDAPKENWSVGMGLAQFI
ncbi:MAG: tautomerase family protein [Proteobacteria bacterium]|nr:tautomerase family protein [Pseudomonadota bacterium]